MDRKSDRPLRLFTPGPVDLSESAARALRRPIPHHRSDDFRRIMDELSHRLKAAILTDDDVVTVTCSGTGVMEAAVANLFSSGDKVLIPVSGKFSGRWAEICEAYGVRQHRIDLAPGSSPAPDRIADELKAHDDLCAVLLTHCETSTGSLTDLEAICSAVRQLELQQGRRILICADCITSLCIDELKKDDWRVDCIIAASQKGLLSPPGLGFVALSREAVARMKNSGVPRYYLDLRKYLVDPLDCPFTPAISLVGAVTASLVEILRKGLERVWRASRSSASAVRLLVEAAGLKPLAEIQASAVVAFWIDDPIAENVRRILEDEHGIVIARGQGGLRGRILRVSPIGKGARDMRHFAEAFEATMAKVGRPLDMGGLDARLKRILEDCVIWE